MREKRIQLIRKRLVLKMEQLWSNAGQTLTNMKNTEGTFPDPFDLAATESNKYVELMCRNRERDLLLEIQETILRIDRGLYGVCDSCGRVITEKRLRIEPMSRLCTTCQEEKEIRHKRKNGNWNVKGTAYQHV